MTSPRRSAAPLLTVSDLTVRFRGAEAPAVDRVSFAVASERTLALVGESGSGKSTITDAILGLLPPSADVSGSIRFGDLELLGMPERELAALRGKELALVLQNPMTSLDPVMTVRSQLRQALRLHGPTLPREDLDTLLVTSLRELGFADPARVLESYPHELSGGMKQRVVIAMAMLHEPALIVADEPSTALDVTVQAQVLQTLATARARAASAMLIVTHDLGVVASQADDMVVLRRGAVMERGQVLDVFDAPQSEYTRALLEAVPHVSFEPRPQRAASGGVSPPSDRSALLSIRDLTKVYRARRGRRREEIVAVDGVSLDIGPGEVVALVGESGSGKSTIGKCVVGFERPDGGSVHLLGRETAASPRRSRDQRRAVQLIFQDPYSSLDPQMTIAAVLSEALALTDLPRRDYRERIAHLLQEVELPASFADRFPHQLSGGQRQRVGIARALATDPRLLVLDESVSALDVSVRARILTLLGRLRESHLLSYLFITHDLAVVSELADRVVVLYRGKVVSAGTLSGVFGSGAHPYARALAEAVLRPDPRLERGRVIAPFDPAVLGATNGGTG